MLNKSKRIIILGALLIKTHEVFSSTLLPLQNSSSIISDDFEILVMNKAPVPPKMPTPQKKLDSSILKKESNPSIPKKEPASSIIRDIRALSPDYRFLKNEPILEAALSGTWPKRPGIDLERLQSFHFNVNTSYLKEKTVGFEIWNKDMLVLSLAMQQFPKCIPVRCPMILLDIYKRFKYYVPMDKDCAAFTDYPTLFKIIHFPFTPKIYIESGTELSPTYRALIQGQFQPRTPFVFRIHWEKADVSEVLQSFEDNCKPLVEAAFEAQNHPPSH